MGRSLVACLLVVMCIHVTKSHRYELEGTMSGGCESECVYIFTLPKDDEGSCPSLTEAAEQLIDESTLSKSLLAYYPLDKDENDYSGNCRHGTKIGTATFSGDEAICGNSRFFNGASKIEVDAFSGFNFGEAFSVSVWIKRTGQFGNYQGIVNNGYYTTGSWEIRMGREGSGTMIGGGVVTGGSSTTWDYVINNVFQRNTWQHVVMSYDGTSGNLVYYINNVVQSGSQSCCSGPILVRDNPLTIGQAGPGTNVEYFYGYLDEIKLFSRALSSDEVSELYNEPCGNH